MDLRNGRDMEASACGFANVRAAFRFTNCKSVSFVLLSVAMVFGWRHMRKRLRPDKRSACEADEHSIAK